MDDGFLMHGGADAQGVAAWDFSTNANACGPCPEAVQALQAADRRHYPDPAYTDLRALLGAWHGVAPQQVLIAASASELIQRITQYAWRSGLRQVVLPQYSYGDYARAAQAWGLEAVGAASADLAALHWACQPSSPLGRMDAALECWPQQVWPAASLRVIDCAYVPLRLDGRGLPQVRSLAQAWQLWTPNKALGLTGVRAAYAIAPPGQAPALAALGQLAPSWPLGADGVALLTAWVQPSVQQWVADCRAVLADWKAQQIALCQDLGWEVLPGSLANYFCARLPVADVTAALQNLRCQGVKLRDCASFGLPGCVRLGVLAPPAQQALRQAWLAV